MRKLRLLVALFYTLAAGAFFAVWLGAQLGQGDAPAGAERQTTSSYQELELALLGWKLQFLDTPAFDRRVVIVSLDWKATKVYGSLPWPRDVFAELIVALRRARVRTIVFDPLFADPQLKFLSPAAYRSLFPALPLADIRIVNPWNYVGELRSKLGEAEKKLARAAAAGDATAAQRLSTFRRQRDGLLALSERIRRGDASLSFERVVSAERDVVFPTDYSNTPSFGASSDEALALLARQAIGRARPTDRIARYRHALTLYPRLLRRRPMVGVNDIERTQRPFVARAQLLIRFRDRLLVSSIPRAVAHFTGVKLQLRRGGAPLLRMGNAEIQLEPDGSFPLAYYDDPSFPPVIDAIDLLRERVKPGALAGKLAIIDIRTEQTASALRVPTPIHGERWASDVKATLASNLLAGHRGPTVSRPIWLVVIEGCAIWLLAGLFAVIAFRVSLLRSIGVAAALVGLAALVDYALCMPARLWFGSAILVVEIPLLMIANIGAHYLIQRAERRRVRRAFGFYLPGPVLEHVLKDERSLRLGGERRELSVLFSDIRGFTNLSERADPEALGEALNIHLTQLTEAVFEHGGTLDKYMGDCIMAFFGAPVADEQHASRAVRAAVAMQRRLEAIQSIWQQKCGAEIKIGVGVATGEVVVGNMGSEKLFDYTVIGDTVNLASRLEGLTKVYGVEVLVDERTRQLTADEVSYLEVDLVRVKGKQRPVAIHEAVAVPASSHRGARDRYAALCREGLAAFRERDWETARERFAAAQELTPEARLPALYAERIAALERDDPGPDWDGVTAFDHK